jgi:hypothetical protein|tara:strand:+ start:17 stop:199 length:183 start_codon:yes stop_codon:yes gene_type:complete
MELKEEININGFYLSSILKIVTNIKIEDKEYDFIYGIDEYTEDLNKIKKQFKRLWLKKKR